MSIEREGSEITFLCDGDRCNEICRTNETDFFDALAQAKREGWKVRKIAGEWMHFCPDEDE